MDIDLIKIKLLDKTDWKQILNLSVSSNQEGYIENSQKCFDDAMTNAYNMEWDFYGIYFKTTLIGFAMHGIGDAGYINDTKLWLDRFMIDKRYQGKGYGKKSMILIIEKLYEDYTVSDIYLSVHDDNFFAIGLYQSLGFSFTNEIDPMGELVMRHEKH